MHIHIYIYIYMYIYIYIYTFVPLRPPLEVAVAHLPGAQDEQPETLLRELLDVSPDDYYIINIIKIEYPYMVVYE